MLSFQSSYNICFETLIYIVCMEKKNTCAFFNMFLHVNEEKSCSCCDMVFKCHIKTNINTEAFMWVLMFFREGPLYKKKEAGAYCNL